MRIRFTLLTALVLAPLAIAGADRKTSPVDVTAAFGRLKTLVGEWQADTKMGKARLSYELIAGGTTLVEKETIGEMAMLTVYHLDGDRLLLTHYCMAGNQPRMQARAFNSGTGEIDFGFLDATNLKPGAGHMHDAKIRIVNDRELMSHWTFFEKGQPKETEAFQYTRVNQENK
jgi:hypothetical protein